MRKIKIELSIYANMSYIKRAISPAVESLNNGKLPNLCFYRENKGRETDIVRMDSDKLDLFEVKSSQTYNKSFEKNLNYLHELLGDKIRSKVVVYDGEFIPPTVVNIRQLTKL